MKSSTRISTAIFIALSLAPTLAQAHPGHGAGFSSGVAHPFQGLDHILAMIAVGFWAAQLGGRARWAVPAAFVTVMTLGSALGMAGIRVPYVDAAIVGSVVMLGLLILAAVRLPLFASTALVGAFALFHGLAHGAELPTNASGLTFALGFALATAALHAFGLAVALVLKQSSEAQWVRVAGAAITVGGLMLAVG